MIWAGIYDPETGIIRGVVGGPTEDACRLNMRDGEAIIFASDEIDNGRQIVDVTASPPALVDAAQAMTLVELVSAIVTERGRRLALGFDYDFGDARGVHRIGTSDQDMRGWDDVTRLAGAMINAGIETPIAIITETGPTTVTPTEWQLVLVAAGEFGQPIWQASFTLQAMDPIPQDVTNNSYWPVFPRCPWGSGGAGVI